MTRQAGKDAAHKELIEKGIADLDRKSGEGGYRRPRLGGAARRRAAADRGRRRSSRRSAAAWSSASTTSKEVWPIFGYEGESYSKGGYIERGFNDIEWL